MKVTLNQEDIKKALIAYVGNQGISTNGKTIDITLKAGRGVNGLSATVNISNDDQPSNILTHRELSIPATVLTKTDNDHVEYVEDECDKEKEPLLVESKTLFGI